MAVKTEAITVDIPEHLVSGIRKQVQQGVFASESDAIVARLQQTDDYSWTPEGPIDGLSNAEWEAEVQRRIDEHEKEELNFLTINEVLASLTARRTERDAA